LDTGIKKDDFLPIDFDPFGGPEIIRVVPAIEPQLEIWVSCILGGEDASRSYNESVSLLLSGTFNYDAMRFALRDLLERHEALRSSFSADGKQICINKELPLLITFADLSSQEPDQHQTYLTEFSKKDAETSFDLLNGPLFRFAVLKISQIEHYLKISAHHIICDGWSLGIMLQDLSKLYSAYAKNETPHLPQANKFSQYALDQWAFSETEEYKNIVQYWVDQYKGDVPVLNLPTDFPRPSARTYKSQRDDYALNTELVSAVKAMGAKAGCSFVTTLLAAFEVYLHRLTGQKDIVLGLPAAGQSATGNYSLVGHCVNLLPLKASFEGETSFFDYLKSRKKEIFNDYDHQQFTFGSLLKKLNIQRDPSRVPLVPVVFNIDMGLDDGVAFEGLKHQLGYTPREYENFEIFLNASGSERLLVLEWSYNTQLFKPATINRMMDEFVSLLEATVNDPSVKIKDIPLKPLNEIYSKLKRWNDTHSDYPRQKTFQDLFVETVNKYSEKTALRFGQKIFSYKNINETSNQLAAYLLDHHVRRGDIVALAVDRSPEMLIILIAIMKSGAAYVPVDPLFPRKRIEFVLQDSSAKVLITSKKYKGRFQTVAKELLIEEILAKLSAYPKDDIKTDTNGNDLAYILYTSGSTGNPKGVQIEHHSLINFLLSMQKKPGIQPGDSLLAITTISFDIAGLELYLPLISGAELVLADTESVRDGRVLLDIIEAQGITMMQATPSTWRMIIEAGWEKRLPLNILCGGEALPKDLADKLMARGISLWNMYGPTETTIWSAVKKLTSTDESITIGTPIDNTQLFILDDYLKPLPEGSVGEIYIGGDGIARGYLNLPDLTNERFVHNPLPEFSGTKIYRTGDLGKFVEGGEAQCLGRIDHQVKIHGYRIELEEIEQALIKEIGIKEAVVVANQERLVAYLVLDGTLPQVALTGDADRHEDWQIQQQVAKWKQGIKELLPEYMLPKEFVVLKKMPLTPNGKIDRNALPRPLQNTETQTKKFTAPRTAIEKLIAGIWAKLLGLDTVSIHDDFFELGGHSLIAVQAMTNLEKQTGRRLPLASLFEAPTVEKLSQLLERNETANSFDSLVAIKPKGSKMPLYIVHGFGMNVLLFNNVAKNMDSQQPVYALQAKGLNTNSGDESAETMEDIAAYYVSEILKQNPEGPYALAGYSLGGIIGFEMAKQLKAMGKEIKMLAMFDTYADNSNYFNPFLLNVTKKFRRQLPKMLFILRSFFRQPWQTLLYQAEFVNGRFRKLFGMRPKNEDEGPSYDDKLAAKYEYAYVNYKMTPYDGEIDLFKVKTRLYYLDDMIYLGWNQFAQKGVNVYEITGDHKTFLYPPHDKEFARILQQALDERAAIKEIGRNPSQGKSKLKAV
jgi:amino acid adenylation domain-containing protein